MAKRRIFLHGPLKKLCPTPIELDANTVLEAISGMTKLLGLKPNPITGRITLKVQGFEQVDDLTAPSDTQDLHVVPAVAGGKSGFFQIILGAVLIAASILLPPVGLVAGLTLNAMLFGIGASMLLGGLMQTLFPVKVADRNPDPNSYLGAPGNTTQSGTRIPLVLGRTRVYGQFLSYNVDALQS